jgi:tetratricopeptide (TPR) repeat protein
MSRLLAAVALSVGVGASSCATSRVGLGVAAVRDQAKLRTAVDAFYRAQTVEALRAAVDEASAAGPDTALFHEVAATFAQLEGREHDVLVHWLGALLDTSDDQALLHLHTLMALDHTLSERVAVRDTLLALAFGHPSSQVRAASAFWLGSALTAEGDLEARDELVAGIPGRVRLAWVGTWDNDQGKGFDLELAPEASPGLDQTYEGRTGRLSWRRDVPTDPRGRYDLSQLMAPARWSAAFAQGTLQVATAGRYALSLTTSDPLKVWVDGALVFAAPQLERSVFDQVVVPLDLQPGPHRLLIKSAHREGGWHLLARFEPWGAGRGDTERVATLHEAVTAHVPSEQRHEPRGLALTVGWAHLAAGGVTTVKFADRFAGLFNDSLIARTWLIDALWFNQERGRTADLLAAFDAQVGDALPFIRLRQTRFWQQQGLKQRARERLLELVKTKPFLREAFDQLAESWRSEGWVEDELNTLRERRQRFGASADELLELGRAELRLGHRAAGLAHYEEVLDELPYHAEALRRLAELDLEQGDHAQAETRALQRLESWPVDTATWLQLAEVRRRRGDFEGARAALAEAEKLAPEASTPLERRGALAYQQGDPRGATKAWKRALELNPENESLANRVDALAPEARGPWMADLPDELSLTAVVQRRETVTQVPGADVAWLLDHEVSQLNTDGSTTSVVTQVVHAWNAQGRDRIIRQSVGAGRLRVLHAYSVDDKGARSEAASERNKQIFFRGMQPGSTLVLQYRLDAPPKGYLARYYTETWSFQGVGEQRLDSTFVLWAPATAQLHEARVGEGLTRVEQRHGDQRRYSWSAKDSAPVTGEPNMPTLGELALNVKLSTVPDWKAWLSWEQALLEGAFRDSPQLDALARKLGAGDPDPTEKLLRVHSFVMEDIRYQQDYESFIAGVKPHPAPVTLERRYGDCKDKAVLFIQLAKKLGVEAHFALVRTRDAGPVEAQVPMQQFNHAIVYVPEQPGVQARFFDPTAELLDLDAVRADDVGTRSLVFDPQSGTHTWREIPYQAPEANRDRTTLELELDELGGAKGSLTLESVGRSGSMLRRTARNAEVFKQVAQRLASVYVPNVTTSSPRALEVESLRVPAAVRVDLSSGTFARPEGDTLRVKLPSEANPRATFQLATRRYPLVLGTPGLSQLEVVLTLPAGWEVKKLPLSNTVTLPCVSLSRELKVEGRVVKSTQRWRTTCERIAVEDYAAYRGRLDDMVRLLDDELVLGPVRKATTPTRGPRPN